MSRIKNKQLQVLSSFDFNSQKGINLLDPTNPQDAVTKAYLGSNSISVGFAQTVDVTVVSTILETSLLGTGTGSKIISANTAVIGKSVTFRISGYYSHTSGTHTIRFKLGAVTIATVAFSVNATNLLWAFEFSVIFRTIGVSGTVSTQATQAIANTTILSAIANTAVSTIDTTVNNSFDFTVQHSVINIANTITSTNATIISTS